MYIYVSNATPDKPVFFDNLQVTHVRGVMLEETHYYPFGLPMAGISYKALNGIAENKNKYNGIEYETFIDLNIGESIFRSHDPQVGRWWQLDPKSDKFFSLSPYSGMADNPILFTDKLGDEIGIYYTETVTKKNGKKVEQGRLFIWEPGRTFTGTNEGVSATIQSLEKLYEKKDLLNISFQDDQNQEIHGNVLTDFLKGGKFEKKEVIIYPGMETTKSFNKESLGAGTNGIWYNYREGLELLEYADQAAGRQAPFFGLLHEFGHKWLNFASPKRMERMAYSPLNPRGNSYEEQVILSRVQSPEISKAFGQGIQIYYDHSRTYTTRGPLTTEEANK